MPIEHKPDDWPRYMYHPDGRGHIFKNEDDFNEHGEGFVNSPDEYGVETCPAAPVGHMGAANVMPGWAAPKSEAKPSPQAQPPAPPTPPLSPEGEEHDRQAAHSGIGPHPEPPARRRP